MVCADTNYGNEPQIKMINTDKSVLSVAKRIGKRSLNKWFVRTRTAIKINKWFVETQTIAIEQ